jgi:pimeloyl-ACP methyl ester carboxylesterase
MGGRNAYVFASRHPESVKALAIVDTGPQMAARGESRMRRFRELPDELGSYQEFADRVQAYTGRPRDQVLGALKYSIRERPDGKWTWKYDRLLRTPGFRPGTWEAERLWDCIGRLRCPTLVVRGGNSDLFPPEVMDRMLRLIPGSTGAVVPGAGHLVAGDNPAGFLEALHTLLARVR